MVDVDKSQLTNLLRFLSGEKSTAVNRMQTSFNWAFAVLTIFVVGVLSRTGFPNVLCFFLLNVALVFLSHFFIRTAKDYVNQIRFAALEKSCLKVLFSLPSEGKEPDWSELGAEFDKYFVQWRSPKPIRNVVKKTLFDHGFFALYVVVLILWFWVAVSIKFWSLRPLATFLATAIYILLIMRRDFGGFYFSCDSEEATMRGKD